MAVSFVAANAAYQAAAKVASAGAAESAAQTASIQGANGSFSDALASAVKEAAGTMRTGEAAAMQGATGKGDVVQVVNAVTAAELTLETVVAIRDRVISAYQDIMKMPI
ncbi:MAG TPA: flagellar hook-basal body complex protein FliE [Micropepsaceae bacterium]|jgi:flagellar hook-basal body complex protein FliE|nr:flagellar hook-basal body complex protein FliE [Micropepsaceae bacterium]